MTNYTSEDTLSQIGLGYPILCILFAALAMVRAGRLTGYWLAWAMYSKSCTLGQGQSSSQHEK